MVFSSECSPGKSSDLGASACADENVNVVLTDSDFATALEGGGSVVTINLGANIYLANSGFVISQWNIVTINGACFTLMLVAVLNQNAEQVTAFR